MNTSSLGAYIVGQWNERKKRRKAPDAGGKLPETTDRGPLSKGRVKRKEIRAWKQVLNFYGHQFLKFLFYW